MLLTDLLHIILAFALSFLLAIAAIPPIIRVAKEKKLFDPPNERKLHTAAIPPLGGVAIFLAFCLSVILSSHGLNFYPLRYLLGALLIMFFIGLMDDMITLSARKKFVVQVISVLILISMGNVCITNLHGLFGIQEIPYLPGVLLTLFVVVAIINAFNLIDGIDGLSSGLAIMASLVMGCWFFLADYIQFSIIAFALTGSLAGFFLYNVFGRSNKLFMGDTGSLVVGMILAVLIIRFNEVNINKTVLYAIGAAPSVSFAFVMIPLVDTLRVMTIRIMYGRSPFSPDKNHIHHRLLELFPNHLTVTLIMIGSNLLIIGLALILNNQMRSNTLQFLIVFSVSVLMSFMPSYLVKLAHVKENTELKTAASNSKVFNKNDNVKGVKTKRIYSKKNFSDN